MQKKNSPNTENKERALQFLKELFPDFDPSFTQRVEELIRVYEDVKERQQGRPSTLI